MSEPGSTVTVELFGVARLAAGERSVSLEHAQARTAVQAVAALAARVPALVGPVIDPVTHRLREGYALNLNGRDFLIDHGRPLAPGDRLLLIASAAGGQSGADEKSGLCHAERSEASASPGLRTDPSLRSG